MKASKKFIFTFSGGPWSWWPHSAGGVVSQDLTGLHICTQVTALHREANARLIAAAPELLNACLESLQYIQPQVEIEVIDGGVGGRDAVPGSASHLHDVLVKAISKAANP